MPDAQTQLCVKVIPSQPLAMAQASRMVKSTLIFQTLIELYQSSLLAFQAMGEGLDLVGV